MLHSSRQSSRKRGFTLAEIMVVVVIIGILSLMFLPNINRSKGDAEINLMKSKATALNAAQASYMQAYGLNNAINNWPGTSDGAACYARLKPFIGYPPATLTDYLLAGYTCTFPATPQNPVRIYRPDGVEILYL